MRFVTIDRCLMQFLREQLDDPHAAPCGLCANCIGQALPREVEKRRARRRALGVRRVRPLGVLGTEVAVGEGSEGWVVEQPGGDEPVEDPGTVKPWSA